VHGAPYRFRDPARFSMAHGGKDRHPYPVPINVYDETMAVGADGNRASDQFLIQPVGSIRCSQELTESAASAC